MLLGSTCGAYLTTLDDGSIHGHGAVGRLLNSPSEREAFGLSACSAGEPSRSQSMFLLSSRGMFPALPMLSGVA